eukprot:TRINITY_DN13531_c0_g1_i2.p1 TRINITY_DN13531_c0_g1~~TRINITY_DN13531_c0_g1_i2.p1  ORF type:complete len:303 (+),score=82.10 TRINITY_DN13531_c0_g1_i2:236-1144(+)
MAGWEESANMLLEEVATARRELAQQQHGSEAAIHANFQRIRALLDDSEARLSRSSSESLGAREMQLAEWERNAVAHRDSLRSGTREIQTALSQGDMALVSIRSKELEVSTNALREMEAALPSLASPMGTGVDLSQVEAAIRSLGLGSTAGVHQEAPGSHPASSLNHSSARASPPTAGNVSGFGGSTLAASPIKPSPAKPTPFTPEATGRGTAVPNAIYINGVPEETTEAELREVFEKFGQIKMINSRHIATGGFAFVFFSSEDAASAALEKPKVLIHGKPVNILAKKQLVPKDRSVVGSPAF